jgi:phage-related baseplate assembly protein
VTSTFSAIDLSKLEPPAAVEQLSYESIYQLHLAEFQARWPDYDVTLETDPAIILLQVGAYREYLLRGRVNDAVRAVMPAFAVGADLDHIAAILGVSRLEISPANTEEGIPAVMESDDAFRRRMVLAPEGYSVAGPEGAYVYHALTADSEVMDAAAASPEPDDIKQLVLSVLASNGASAPLVNAMTAALDAATWPGEVVVSVLSREGDGAVSPDLAAAVQEYLSDETIRPLTDHVIVQGAEIVPYSVDATIWTFGGPDGAVVVQAARTRLDAYVAACHRLGRDITISGLHAALHIDGVQRVALSSPAEDIVIARNQAPFCTGITIAYGGLGE